MIAKTLASLASKLFAGLAGVGMALALQLSHAAPLLNAGFETGNLTGWNIGGASSGFPDAGWGVVSELTTPPLVPTQGGFMAMVSNAARTNSAGQQINHGLPPGVVNGAGGNARSRSRYRLGTPPAVDLSHICPTVQCVAVSVAELWQTFSVDGASTLSFDWNFLTNELSASFIDTAFVSIIGPSSQILQFLALNNAGPPKTGTDIDLSAQDAGQYGFQTGWLHSEFALSQPGDYTFVLGVSSGGDTLFSAALLIDNVQVVPEPATLALRGLGLAGFGISRRRNKKS